MRSGVDALDDPAEREKRADGAIGCLAENPRVNSERPFCPAVVVIFAGGAAVFETHRILVNGNVNAAFSDQRKVALDGSDVLLGLLELSEATCVNGIRVSDDLVVRRRMLVGRNALHTVLRFWIISSSRDTSRSML